MLPVTIFCSPGLLLFLRWLMRMQYFLCRFQVFLLTQHLLISCFISLIQNIHTKLSMTLNQHYFNLEISIQEIYVVYLLITHKYLGKPLKIPICCQTRPGARYSAIFLIVNVPLIKHGFPNFYIKMRQLTGSVFQCAKNSKLIDTRRTPACT